MAERMFPIQGDFGKPPHPMNRTPAGQVPWKVAERAYEVYSPLYGTDQSLERLAERAGFGWGELGILLATHRYPKSMWRAIHLALLHQLEIIDA